MTNLSLGGTLHVALYIYLWLEVVTLQLGAGPG